MGDVSPLLSTATAAVVISSSIASGDPIPLPLPCSLASPVPDAELAADAQYRVADSNADDKFADCDGLGITR